jgi:hypothetical protein
MILILLDGGSIQTVYTDLNETVYLSDRDNFKLGDPVIVNYPTNNLTKVELLAKINKIQEKGDWY